MTIKGEVHKYGNDINTDVIIPARYLNVSDADELAAHCMEDIDTTFVTKAKQGDIIVAGSNFGCGSSREHAPLAIKTSGITCVIAQSFARIFFRNAIDIGLPLLECIEAAIEIRDGDILEIDLASGKIDDISQSKTYYAKPYPHFMIGIINAGGLINYTKDNMRGI
jgi:3-isopropylmalate/(R)-2-methylmalate dehydratase small subunit